MTRRLFRGTGLPPWELAFAALLFAFSAWIMFRTFSYDAEGSRILIGWMLWGDLGANLPLIRSFSLGQNWPPEYPIFPGPPIQYHYGFFLLVGWLERLGIRLDWALNVPSLLGFFAILLMIHLIAKRLFGDVRVAVLIPVGFWLAPARASSCCPRSSCSRSPFCFASPSGRCWSATSSSTSS